MKLKPNKEKDSIVDAFKDIYSNVNQPSETEIAISVDGCVIIENFRRLVDYTKGAMVVQTKNKTVYIYGNNLVLVSCSRYNAVCKGNIEKIELFDNEV